ncbi:hypothetical protein ABID22_003851 [Pontibacter aydingkolensis]
MDVVLLQNLLLLAEGQKKYKLIEAKAPAEYRIPCRGLKCIKV